MNKGRKQGMGLLAAALAVLFAVAMPAVAASKDGNRDGIPDRWEKRHGLTLKKNQAKLDQDRDGLRNRGEWRHGTNPRKRDTDGDGVLDGREVKQGSDPTIAHPRLPAEDLGQVSAWDAETGVLEVTLAAGGTVSGSVSEFTKIRCPLPAPPTDPVEGEEPTDPVDDPAALRHRRPGGPGANGAGAPRPGGRPGSGLHPGHGPSLRCSTEDLAVGVAIKAVDVRFTAEGTTFIKIALGAGVEEPVEEPIEEPAVG